MGLRSKGMIFAVHTSPKGLKPPSIDDPFDRVLAESGQ